MIQNEQTDYEAIIVGGSFAGLSAAIQLARARRRILVLDHGKPRNRFAPASHGFFGQDGVSPYKILETARNQVLTYPTVEFQSVEATRAEKQKGHFGVAVGEGQIVRAKRLVLATGVRDHLPDIPGMKELWGTGVAHCPYCHGYEVADRKIAVFSVGEPLVHQALLLRDWTEEVTLLTNGIDGLTEEDRNHLHARGVTIEETPVERLIARTGTESRELEGVALRDGRVLAFGALFTKPRCSFASPLAEQLGCETETGMFGPVVKTDAFKASTVPGVYVAGDAARAMHNATFASADGVLAGVFAHQSLVFPPSHS